MNITLYIFAICSLGLILTELKTVSYMPGHPWMLHSMVEVSGPRTLQSSPPFAGGGLVHVLLRVFTPPPQDFEHWPYGPQFE